MPIARIFSHNLTEAIEEYLSASPWISSIGAVLMSKLKSFTKPASIPSSLLPQSAPSSSTYAVTAFYVKGIYYELTLYMDLWNNEIVSHALSSKRGDRMTYISGLADLLELKKQFPEMQTVLHSDQGSVYASKAFNELLPMYNITHSMSRAGTPTDNAAMEAINGWVKAELFMDFHVTGTESVEQEIDDYVVFFNEQRPAYALNYLTPKQYRESYFQNEAV